MMNSVRSRVSWQVVGTVLLLSTTIAVSKLTAYRKIESLAQPLDSIDRRLAGFTSVENPALTEGILAELKPTAYLSRTYSNASMKADVFISYYAQQRAGESMHSPKHCLPGAGWEIWDYGSAKIPVEGGSVEVNRYSISNSGQRMLVLYWYQSKGRIIASEYTGKLLLAGDALLQNSTAASIVRIIVPDQPGALEAAKSLATGLIPEMKRCFGG